jgi:hypothetical protein
MSWMRRPPSRLRLFGFTLFLSCQILLIVAGPAQAQVNVVITADNGYGFGFGPASGIPPGNYFGPVNNHVSASQIFNCPIGNGPEAYNVPFPNPDDFLYIAAWSDQLVTQGVIGQFKSSFVTAAIYTGQDTELAPGLTRPWEVYATGITIPLPLTPTSGPTLAEINAQITLANAGGQPPATTSGTWVGTTPVAGGPGYLAFGQDNSAAGTFPIVCPTALDAVARWMWFNRDPSQPPSFAFQNGNHKEFLIFRVPARALLGVPVGGIPTLSHWALALLVLLIAAYAIYAMRRLDKGTDLA